MAATAFTQGERDMGAQAPHAIAAVILAGGRGERLGGAVKAELRVGGVRLLDRVLPVLAGCRPIVVAHGPHDPAKLGLPSGLEPVADLPVDYAGPLAGFAAAVAAIGDRAELLVCAAVDTPFLPRDYVERLVAGLGDAPAAIAIHGGQPYPTNSIWRLERFRDLPARVLGGTAPRSLKSLAAAAGATTVDWPGGTSSDPFANVNTPDDLALAEARAAHG
jgi:molybdopterin-guanine dinucleotide biosynthesis protein A